MPNQTGTGESEILGESIFELPEGWTIAPFLDVMDYEGGTQPPKRQFKYQQTAGYVRLLQIRDFGDRPFPTYVPDSARLKKASEADLLLARYGGNSVDDCLGRICTGLSGAYNVALVKLIIPQDEINRDFVQLFFKGPWFRTAINRNSRSCQMGFNRNDLKSLSFPLPPRAEQDRIVLQSAPLLRDLEIASNHLSRIPNILKRFRVAVLSAACSGKLTADWRDSHPDPSPDASELIRGIFEERNRRYGLACKVSLENHQTRPKPPKNLARQKIADKDLPEIPETWQWVCWDDLADWITYGFTRPMPHVPHGIPIVTATNVRDGFLDFSQLEYTTKKAFAELSEKDKPRRNEILITKDGAIRGRAALVGCLWIVHRAP